MSEYLKELLKIGTTIDHVFIDEFYQILTDPDEKFSIHMDTIISWLELDRKEFIRNMKKSKRLSENDDYVIEFNYSGQNYRRQDIWFTKEAFKTICMYTKSKKGDLVRKYFIEVEKFLDRNKYVIINHMIKELEKANLVIKQLQLNQSHVSKFSDGGYVYVYTSSTVTGEIVYKIGMSRDMNSRISNQNTAHPDNLNLVAIMRTENPESVEACLHGILKGKRYRRNREFFHDITVSQIKQLLDTCQDMTSIYTNEFNNNVNNTGTRGGFPPRVPNGF